MRAIFLILIFSLSGANTYPIAEGKKITQGWERVSEFRITQPGWIFLSGEGDALIINPFGEILPFSRDTKIPSHLVSPGRYFLLLKSPTSWKILFLPSAEWKKVNRPLTGNECSRWLRKKDFLEEGKTVSEKLEKLGIVALYQLKAKLPEKIEFTPDWLSWWDEKPRKFKDFNPTQDASSADYIYKLPLIMEAERKRTGKVFCIPGLEAEEPFLPSIYRYLGWDNVNSRTLNSVAIRLSLYIKLREKEFSPEDAYLRAESQAREEYYGTQESFSDLPEIFEKIYRRFFQW